MDEQKFIGCCGAYCKACRSFVRGDCKGCKLGFDIGDRNINRTGCTVKKCCFRDKKYETCADCNNFDSCNYMENWYKKGKGKYRAYKKYIDFIKENGYTKFIEIANAWKSHFGEIGERK
jgi:hypothetical protein